MYVYMYIYMYVYMYIHVTVKQILDRARFVPPRDPAALMDLGRAIIRNPNSQILNPRPETIYPKPFILNHLPETIHRNHSP